TLLRYHVLANQPDVPAEVRFIVSKMISEVLAVDPYFLGAPGHPLDLKLLETEDTLEAQALTSWREAGRRDAAADAAREAFDAQLDGYESRLVGSEANAEHIMAEAVRTVLGVTADEMTDDAALA